MYYQEGKRNRSGKGEKPGQAAKQEKGYKQNNSKGATKFDMNILVDKVAASLKLGGTVARLI